MASASEADLVAIKTFEKVATLWTNLVQVIYTNLCEIGSIPSEVIQREVRDGHFQADNSVKSVWSHWEEWGLLADDLFSMAQLPKLKALPRYAIWLDPGFDPIDGAESISLRLESQGEGQMMERTDITTKETVRYDGAPTRRPRAWEVIGSVPVHAVSAEVQGYDGLLAYARQCLYDYRQVNPLNVDFDRDPDLDDEAKKAMLREAWGRK